MGTVLPVVMLFFFDKLSLKLSMIWYSSSFNDHNVYVGLCLMHFYRWANQGLDFLTVACDPKMLTFISETKFQVDTN